MYLKKYHHVLTVLFLLLLSNNFAGDKVPAFPGAEGYGRFAAGGRGGEVICVTSLNDHGEGTLRAAIKKDVPRIIVFKVSGYIELESPLHIKNGNITIAGQTAPGEGICLKNYPLEVSADNVIIRYIRSRLGDQKKQQEDAVSVRFSNNMIIDHCSFSWAVDECATFYTNQDFTLQWSIISESLNSSVHRKGEHGYGGIWGGIRASFHHNLLAHHKSRAPRFSGLSGDGDLPSKDVDFRNNVIYNWENNSSYGGEEGEYTMINNYYKPGPATEKDVIYRIVNPYEPYGKFYLKGNYVAGNRKVSENNLAGGIQCDEPNKAIVLTPFAFADVKTQSPEEAYKSVLAEAGASLNRDSVDKRVINEVREGTYTYKGSITGSPGIIDSENDAGGYPALKSEPAPPDTDNDGMPDKWEKDNGLNPNDPSDAAGRNLNDAYDNIEVYINSLVN